jgi:hypothetical protein
LDQNPGKEYVQWVMLVSEHVTLESSHCSFPRHRIVRSLQVALFLRI